MNLKRKGMGMVAITCLSLGIFIIFGISSICRFHNSFPNMQDNILQSFITPHNELVIKYSNQIDNSPKGICYWINSNFNYKSEDKDSWSTPHETLSQFESLGYFYGDCEDVSFLVTSLFRSKGYSFKDVRTTLGIEENGLYLHAWTEIKINQKWIPLEFGSWDFLDNMEINHPFIPIVSFNDKYIWRCND